MKDCTLQNDFNRLREQIHCFCNIYSLHSKFFAIVNRNPRINNSGNLLKPLDPYTKSIAKVEECFLVTLHEDNNNKDIQYIINDSL